MIDLVVLVALTCIALWGGWFKLFVLLTLFLARSIKLFISKKTPVLRPPISDVVQEVPKETTDLTKWHLTTAKGRHEWIYREDQKPSEQNITDKYFLGLDISAEAPNLTPAKTPQQALENGLEFYCKLQMSDGHWGNDYGGPLFLMPGIIFTTYISGTPFTPQQTTEMIRYLTNQQRTDGGWGLHIESVSTMFGTVMNYCAMRVLGLKRGDPRMIKARKWIEEKGGALSVPAWGKFWLAALNLYEWEGLNPVPPELWALPYFLPFHPGRWWCHTRVVYLPMAYIFGRRLSQPVNTLISELREEIYIHKYETIDWRSQRFHVFADDSYKSPTLLHRFAFGALGIYEDLPSWLIAPIRNYALASTLDHIRYEDRETKGICIGPVNKALDMLAEYWASNGSSDAFKQHQTRVADYLWLAADGMKMQGYNGSQLWDTAFSLQAIKASGLADSLPNVREAAIKGYGYIDMSQVRQNNTNYKEYYRHISKGAWPFSTIDHGWPISDCTAEGFACALEMPLEIKACAPLAIDTDRIFDAVNVMLSYQNPDGGWPSYENRRGPEMLEAINPADCFDKIMVDYSYVECSGSCIKALLRFKEVHPTHRTKEIETAVERGVKFLQDVQRPDGSWHGCWGVCYTYGAWFACTSLSLALKFGIGQGVQQTLDKAYNFLLSKQHEDGSWGEDFKSCSTRQWVDLPEGHIVNTSWAVICLLTKRDAHKEAIDKGIQWIVKNQMANGDWAQTTISGVFNYNCAISYSGFKNYFPIWALSSYLNPK